MATLPSISQERTLLEVVDWLVENVGDRASGDIADGREVTGQAIIAANDALHEVWNRRQWEFRKRLQVITLVQSTGWYDLEEDFHEFDHNLPVKLGSKPIYYRSFEDLVASNPWFQMYPPTLVDLTINQNVINDDRHFGTPLYYTYQYVDPGYKVLFFPAPDSDAITANGKVVVPYFAGSPNLIAASDLVPLPTGLWAAHKYLALAYLKQTKQQQDFQADEARAERYIQREMARSQRRGLNKPRVKPVGHR
jgi:hypothetical protein